MSIAVSATILPSRILAYTLVFMFALLNIAVGYAVVCFFSKLIYIFIVIFLCILMSGQFLLGNYRGQQAVRLDISDSGDIIFRSVAENALKFEAIYMKLVETSTLWPQLMMLSLCTEDGKIVVVPVLRDSVDAATFRRLSVALNWIAMHASSGTKFSSDIPSGTFN